MPSSKSDLPDNLSRPARRALAQAGVTRLADVARWTDAGLLALHGVGPKTIRQLRPLLAAKGLSFVGSDQDGK